MKEKSGNLLKNAVDVEGWTESSVSNEEIGAYYKYKEGNPIVVMKSHCKNISCTAEELAAWIFSSESSKEIDPMFQEGNVLKVYDEDHVILHAKYSAPWPIYPRDFTFA